MAVHGVRMRMVKRLIVIGLLLAAGCGTVDARNVDSKPWNRPTKADLSKDWWFDLRQYYDSGSGSEYP
jgi:hypothetical protein